MEYYSYSERSIWNPGYRFLPHRVFAALAAIWDRLRGLSFAALAAPPFKPPRRPSATAAGFLGFSSGWYFGVCPVDSSMTWYASSLGSLGRFLFERSGMTSSAWQRRSGCVKL